MAHSTDNKALGFKDTIVIGMMTFALFLGAGNVIFPAALGLEAGTNLLPTMAGFLFTAVGLPAFIMVALGMVGKACQFTAPLTGGLGRAFWVSLFIAIGPAFAMPRAVTVAYEMGLRPFVEGDYLLPFTIVFSLVILFLTYNSQKLVDWIGKLMTPAMIAILAAISVAALLFPLGSIAEPVNQLAITPVTEGMMQGYMTMDALGAVGYGWVIMQAINSRGVTSSAQVAKSTMHIAMIYSVLMGGCYLALSYVGATANTIAQGATNGGEILSLYVYEIFGGFGQLLLAAIMILACLSTAVGVAQANAEYFSSTFKVNQTKVALVVVIVNCFIANFGLDQIITFSLPGILILCPVALALVLASVVSHHFPQVKPAHNAAMILTLVFGTIDAMSIIGVIPASLDSFFAANLPLYTAHTSWLIPCVTAIVVQSLISVLTGSATKAPEAI
ncbi:branched-chain amino acid transport system II carrier protein [Endozoicomonas euniceicola]|uniref:Branched-chain amino acid transport system carrier protein n=1 Tax=Endozoicomonas euniceicola TaxID=1234143 RepID=A0ABY6GSX8_9GAMM|nr:branched-chain amino acid transport system II carrier protein [Endozoicomonas euniceicola]UYM15867.1 branched-chain amino acid transport system II carrier protein [Endozoicomonas euniceicola]